MLVRVALVQFETKQYDSDYNLIKAEQFINDASKKGVNIVVFPEDFILGPLAYRLDLIDTNNKYLNHFVGLSKKYNIDVVPGTIIEKDKMGLWNVSYYIDNTGRVLGKYKKINLWHPERSYINSGNRISVFNTKYGKIGLSICWDLMFPELFRRMVKKGVKIIICPSCWTSEDEAIGNNYNKNSSITIINNLCAARAIENEVIFIYVNGCGDLILPEFKGNLFGHSQICAPFIGCLDKLDHNKEDMLIVDVDTNILNDAEKVHKIRKDLREYII